MEISSANQFHHALEIRSLKAGSAITVISEFRNAIREQIMSLLDIALKDLPLIGNTVALALMSEDLRLRQKGEYTWQASFQA